MASEVAEGIAAGASQYLIKPFVNAELLGVVVGLLEGHDTAGTCQPSPS